MAIRRRFDPVDQYGRVLDWTRLKRAARRKKNWGQLVRFCVIGGTGYVVNVAVFAACVRGLDLNIHGAAIIAFLGAVGNNFFWNRRWTFPAHGWGARREATRFLVVSGLAFLGSISILTALVTLARISPMPAQMVSIAIAMPVSFAGNKLWTFRRDPVLTLTDAS